MERCVAPSTVEPQASVQSGCSFQTIEFTSRPEKKNTSKYRTSQAFPQETPSTIGSYRNYPLPQDSKSQMKSRHFWGGIPRSFPGKNVSFQPSQNVVFGRIHEKKMLLKLLGFHLWWWRLPGIAHTTTISTTRPPGRFGSCVFFLEVLEVWAFQNKMRGHKWIENGRYIAFFWIRLWR